MFKYSNAPKTKCVTRVTLSHVAAVERNPEFQPFRKNLETSMKVHVRCYNESVLCDQASSESFITLSDESPVVTGLQAECRREFKIGIQCSVLLHKP